MIQLSADTHAAVVSPLATTSVLAPKLGQFARNYPDVVLDVTTDESYLDLVAGASMQRYYQLKGAVEASHHDGRARDAASSESSRVADVAGKAPHVESRDLARVLQGPHRGEVDPLRRHRS